MTHFLIYLGSCGNTQKHIVTNKRTHAHTLEVRIPMTVCVYQNKHMKFIHTCGNTTDTRTYKSRVPINSFVDTIDSNAYMQKNAQHMRDRTDTHTSEVHIHMQT